MNFGKWDMMIFVTMTFAVIAMSFTFPALGMTDMDEAEDDDIPEFNMTTDRFDFADQFPDNPGAPSTGQLVWYEDDPRGERQATDLDPENRLFLFNEGNTTDWELNATLQDWSEEPPIEETVQLTEVGDRAELENDDYDLDITVLRVQDEGTDDLLITTEYQIEEQPQDNVWYDRIPVVGSVFGAGEQLAGIVGWIGSIIYWFVGTVLATILNMFYAMIEIITFLFSLLHWLISTYGSVISASNSWSTVFILIPALLLFLEFVKIGFIAIHIIWIG